MTCLQKHYFYFVDIFLAGLHGSASKYRTNTYVPVSEPMSIFHGFKYEFNI